MGLEVIGSKTAGRIKDFRSKVSIWKLFATKIGTILLIAKDCLLTLVKGRLALGSPGCRSFVRHHAENGPIHRKMVVDCPLVIISKVKLFFRPDKTRKKE